MLTMDISILLGLSLTTDMAKHLWSMPTTINISMLIPALVISNASVEHPRDIGTFNVDQLAFPSTMDLVNVTKDGTPRDQLLVPNVLLENILKALDPVRVVRVALDTGAVQD